MFWALDEGFSTAETGLHKTTSAIKGNSERLYGNPSVVVRYHEASFVLLCAFSSPLKDDEGHEADYNGGQDGAVDGDEFVIQMVDRLLRVTIGGGAGGTDGGCGVRRAPWWKVVG